MTTTRTWQPSFGWRPSPPDQNDYTLRARLPEIYLRTAPVSVPSLTRDLPIQDQSDLGSCTMQAAGRAYRYADRLDGVDFDVSELFGYYYARLESGLPVNQDVGAYNRGAAKALAHHGICDEAAWPYVISRFAQTPPDAARVIAAEHRALEYISVPNNIETMKAVIASGFPIVIGYTVYENYYEAMVSGIWPEPRGRAIAGHAVLVDGYEPGWWLFPNSWGTQVGQSGWFKMSWNYLLNNGEDFWTYKRVSPDRVEPTPPTPPPTPVDEPPYLNVFRGEFELSNGEVWPVAGRFDPPPGR